MISFQTILVLHNIPCKKKRRERERDNYDVTMNIQQICLVDVKSIYTKKMRLISVKQTHLISVLTRKNHLIWNKRSILFLGCSKEQFILQEHHITHCFSNLKETLALYDKISHKIPKLNKTSISMRNKDIKQ